MRAWAMGVHFHIEYFFCGGSTSIKALRQALMWQREGREGAHYF